MNFQIDCTELASRIAYKLQSLLTDKYRNSVKIAAGIIKQELERELRASVVSCGNCGGPAEQAEDQHYYCANPECSNCKPI